MSLRLLAKIKQATAKPSDLSLYGKYKNQTPYLHSKKFTRMQCQNTKKCSENYYPTTMTYFAKNRPDLH